MSAEICDTIFRTFEMRKHIWYGNRCSLLIWKRSAPSLSDKKYVPNKHSP